MNAILERIKNEPVLISTFVGAVLNLIVEFGMTLTDGQEASILGLTVAFLAFFARRKVKPAREPKYQGQHRA